MAKIGKIYIIMAALLLTSCMGLDEKDPSVYLKPDVSSVSVSAENTLYFTFSSGVASYSKVKSCGFYYGRNKDMSGAAKIESVMNYDSFSTEILLKDYESDYYVCSFISNGNDEVVSDPKKITIGPLEDYVAFDAFSVDSYVSSTQKAEVSVSFEFADGVDATTLGVCYGLTKNLSVDGSRVTATKEREGFFTAVIPSLVAGRQYYARPFIIDGEDVAYGETYPMNIYAVPEVKTSEVKKITDNSAHVYGEVINDCGKEIKERGFVLEEGDTNPTVNSMKHTVSGKTGTFDLNITDLKPNTLYSVRAYAKNSEGTAYGKVLNFATNVAMPAVVTERVVNITSDGADVECRISDNGGETVSDCGVLLSTSSDLDPDKSKKISASSVSTDYKVSVTSLDRKTKYYVQAYVTNSVGTAYGDVLEFETLAELPVVSTVAVTEISDRSAKTGGKITDDGGDKVTARGVVWSENQNPTVEKDSRTADGSGTGQYASEVTGLRYETVYYVRAYATNSAGTSYGEELRFTTEEFSPENVRNLAEAGTANCYIVSESGTYRFPAVKGNSSESVGSVASVDVLWETFGTDMAPKTGDLIDYTSYSDGSIVFNVSSVFKEGNALIAAKNSSGTILWSWHIWLTDQPAEQVYANNAGTMMDRNLGATSATPGDVGALGLLYQWGRKDPFLGSSSISSSVEAKSTGSWPSTVASSSSKGTIDYATKNPMTFITYNESNYDWYYTGSSSTDNTRWTSAKTKYDPCPAGWRVPDGGDNGVWAKAGFDDHSYDDIDEGMLFGSPYCSPAAWYPASGCRSISGGSLSGVGNYGYYWSVTPNGSDACSLSFNYNGGVGPSNDDRRANGQSVRCLKEGSSSETPVEPEYKDLSASGTANSYIISKSGDYKFKAVEGNSSTSVGTVSSVEVLWESFGTGVQPNVGDLVKNVSYSNGYIQFSTSATFKEGNALIAAKNSSGTILWSWHIWLTDQPAEQVYANNAGTMMDRNLGATSASPGDVGALGLLYQWGRKDPFLGSSSISSNVEAASTGSWPSAVASSSSKGTIAYATKNPMTFITYNESNYDWYYTGSSSTDDTRWASAKTKYDPCPAGWRVPDGGDNGVWAKAGFDDNPAYDDIDEGMLFGSPYCSPAAWYPAAGNRNNNGSLKNIGYRSFYHSVTPFRYYVYELSIDAGFDNANPTSYSFRGTGKSVRCLKE